MKEVRVREDCKDCDGRGYYSIFGDDYLGDCTTCCGQGWICLTCGHTLFWCACEKGDEE